MSRFTTAPAALRRVLVADDDLVSRMLLEATLLDLGYEVATVADGGAALLALDNDAGPTLAILDWEMPRLSGPEVCRELRARRPNRPWYLLLLTVRGGTTNVVQGLRAGANDHLTKPFDRDELAARLAVASNVLALQASLADRIHELEHALAHIKTLRGLLPICAWCKKIRDDGNYWRQVEDYVACHTEASFTHGICPTCEDNLEEEALRYARASRGA
jgi:sigma-B regulation protein RsbU (phosphoserine phosphatase)